MTTKNSKARNNLKKENANKKDHVASAKNSSISQDNGANSANSANVAFETSLSEADILSMPSDAYMNAQQLEFFRGKLFALEQEILENAKKTAQTFQEQETNYIADPSDRATVEEEYALELRARDRERKLLQKIRKALHLIDIGEYGYCEDSGEPIGLKRLIARPTATLTIEAQERREALQKHFAEA